jgi:ribosomal protein S4
MAFTIAQNDILWSRTGEPVRIASRNDSTGKIILDKDFDKVQETAKFGIRNGLEPKQKEEYLANLSAIESKPNARRMTPDRRQEIRDLYHQIKKLKEERTDPRVIRYLENELQYRIVREKFAPEDLEIEPIMLGT